MILTFKTISKDTLNKIPTIKAIRVISGIGLKEALLITESIQSIQTVTHDITVACSISEFKQQKENLKFAGVLLSLEDDVNTHIQNELVTLINFSLERKSFDAARVLVSTLESIDDLADF